jgi:hypothetical protein
MPSRARRGTRARCRSPVGLLRGFLIQPGPGVAGGGAGVVCFFWKQERHKTGLFWVGLKGTVVSSPHSEQVVLVSARTRVPELRLALHCLQRFGSLRNCLSLKNSCSPAVKTNSAPQSMHIKIRSVNTMAVPQRREDRRSRPCS